MSEQPGWIQTLRYSHLSQHRSNAQTADALSFVAIHGFGEGHKLGMDVEPLDPITDWTRKCMSEVKAIDAAVYHKVRPSAEGSE